MLFTCAAFFTVFNGVHLGLAPTGTVSTAVFLAEMVAGVFLLGGGIWGLYLWVTCRFFDMHTNDGFSAMQIAGYKNFVRLRIKGDELTVYPIGVGTVPDAEGWRDNPKAAQNPAEPKLVPTSPLQPHLIEGPVVINARSVKRMK